MKIHREDSRLELKDRLGTHPSLVTLRRNQTCQHFDFQPLVSNTDKINVCCFKPPNPWYFGTLAIGNSDTEGMWCKWITSLCRSS